MAGSEGLSLSSQLGLRGQAAELGRGHQMNGSARTFSRRYMASSVLGAVAALMLTVGSLQAATALRIGSAQVSIASIPVVVAIQQKLFEAEGITAEIIDFDGGGPAAASPSASAPATTPCGWRAAVSAARCWWHCSTSILIRCWRRQALPPATSRACVARPSGSLRPAA